MKIPAFDPKELKILSMQKGSHIIPETAVYDTPVTQKEAWKATLAGNAYWQVSLADYRLFTPEIVPDNIARAQVFEEKPFDPVTQGGGKDMFGLEWEYVAQVGGSMVRPGKPLMEDANDWKDILVWPDIESWDWEGSSKLNADTFLETPRLTNMWMVNGWYERLISFMDFEGAIMAMVDEDQTDAVTEMFTKLTDLYIAILEKVFKYYPKLDAVGFHDDWGSQRETFFSPKVAQEMIVPHMKRVTKFIHDNGKYAELHSCGQILKQVPNIIEAGWDWWNPQLMNDMPAIYELYGDKICVGVAPEMFDPATTSEDEQRRIAREYVDKFCKPDKPSFFNLYASMLLTPTFKEELYIRSREAYSK